MMPFFHRLRRSFTKHRRQSAWRMALVLSLCLPAAGLRADDYDVLRQKWVDALTGGTNYDLGDSLIANEVSLIARSGSNYWASMNKAAGRTYLWSDAASTTDSADMTTSYTRLQSMAMAYTTYGSSMRGNAALLADLVGGMDWMNSHRYNASSTESGNWWDWQIGTPTLVDNVTALLYGQLSATQISNYMAAVDRFTPTPQQGTSVGSGGSTATGANLVWQAQVVGVRACLVKNTTKLAQARDALSAVFPYVTNKDGFYPDGSFIQHNAHPYNGGYGASLIGTITPLMSWLGGSAWAVTDPMQTNVFQWVYSAFEPFIYKGAMMDLVRGREVSRSTTDHARGQSVMETILSISRFAPAEDAARMRAMVKYWAQVDTTASFVAGTPLTLMPLAEQLMSDTNVVPRGEAVGHYTFADSDRVVHQGTGYGLAIAMSSSRIYNYESINSENLRGWYTGDGMTYLYNQNLRAFSDNFWPTVNPRRLPGITVDATQSRADGSGANYLSPNAWVGGATLDRYGAAGMQLKGYGNSLVAKKSWFMFDDEIVCLGAGISSSDNRPIETIIENRKLSYPAGAEALTVNGTVEPTTLGWSETLSNVSWAHLAGYLGGDDIGYYFPQIATVQALREARTGSWADINAGGSSSPITRNYLSLWFDHGANPANATYAYALLPNRSSREVEDYAGHPQFTVLANSPAVQSVQETTLGITAANFWNDGIATSGGITVDRKASVLVRNDGNFLDISVSDPTQTNGASINVLLNASATAVLSADPGITVTQTAPQIILSVATAGASGHTFKARFYLHSPTISTLAPVADAFVYDALPANNYGTSATMAVKLHAGADRESFLKFDLSSLPAGTVGAANLNLFCGYAHLPGVQTIATVPDNSWTETGLTWSNKPASLTELATWTPASNAPVSVPIASAVAASLAGGSNFLSLRIFATTQTGDGYVDYVTRESGTVSNRPQLVVSFIHNPPVVRVTAPAPRSYLSSPGAVTLAAEVIAGDGVVTNLAFYEGTNLLGSVSSAPYQLTVSLSGGAHHLTAVATDANGLAGQSLPVFISVNGPPEASAFATATPNGVPVEVDLRSLASDEETPFSQLLFTVSSGSNGIVSLLADGHTARFTPGAGYRGPASFKYQVTDTSEDSRLLLHYKLQGNVADATTNSRDGLLNVAGTGAYGYLNDAPALLAPWQSQSLQLIENGTGGAVKIDRYISSAEWNFQASNWTVAGWCKRANTNTSDMVFHLGTGSGGTGVDDLQLRFDVGNNTFRLLNYNASGNDASLTTSAGTGLWHHFSVVHNGPSISLYLNGVLIGTDSSVAITADPAGPVCFGGNGTTSSFTDRWFQGQFSDLAIFTSALSATEINRLAKTLDVAHFGGNTSANTVAVQVLSNLELWRQQSFGSSTNAGSGADIADANGDGEANLMEFATGQDPFAPSVRPLQAVLYGPNLLVAYVRSKAAMADGIGFAIEANDTLPSISWTTNGITESVHADDGTLQTVWATVPMNGKSQRFVRLRVMR